MRFFSPLLFLFLTLFSGYTLFVVPDTQSFLLGLILGVLWGVLACIAVSR